MPSPEAYVEAFRDELQKQTQPDNLPKLVVPAVITGLAVAIARRWM